MNHVDAEHRVGTRDRPVCSGSIDEHGFTNIGEPGFLAPGRYRLQRVWVKVAGLPFKIREMLSEIDGMLTGPAGDLEHQRSEERRVGKECRSRWWRAQ